MAVAIFYTDDMRKLKGYLYILTNPTNTVLYIGVTEDLIKRIWQHKEKLTEGFTKKYNLTKLVYYEVFETILYAIQREKQLKAGSRKRKVELIKSLNPSWQDLYPTLLE